MAAPSSIWGLSPLLGTCLALVIPVIDGALFEERAPIPAPGLATPPFAQFVRGAGPGALFFTAARVAVHSAPMGDGE